VHGPPNFVLDVFPRHSWQDYDLRRSQFEAAGVIEYVAVQDQPAPLLQWNRSVNGKFEPVEEDSPGMICSTALPGLWIPTDALKNRNWWSVMASISQGITRREHHELMEGLWSR
jgi:hypothetical protein